jgi:hypothetical protein
MLSCIANLNEKTAMFILLVFQLKFNVVHASKPLLYQVSTMSQKILPRHELN